MSEISVECWISSSSSRIQPKICFPLDALTLITPEVHIGEKVYDSTGNGFYNLSMSIMNVSEEFTVND